MISGMGDGRVELERAAESLAARVPEPLGVLTRLAYNYRWSWMPGGSDLFASVDPHRWSLVLGNPVRLLQETSTQALARAAADTDLLERAARAEQLIAEELARPLAELSGVSADRPVAFFCAEYALHHSLPIYSGGLGALAGDLLKQASDQRIPMVAVGLLYRQGYFRQHIDALGWQHEYWTYTDPERLPAALVRGDDGRPVTVTVPIWDQQVTAHVWRVSVGRVPLLLLDSDCAGNDPVARWITTRLYVGDPDVRLAQYVLLGVGGVRALRALGVEPGVIHLNEGHAAFAALELARPDVERGAELAEALKATRARTVFTTHTPVPAGNDTYPLGQVVHTVGSVAAEIGLDDEHLGRLGRTHPKHEAEPFGLTQLALRTCRHANAVSRRHGAVAREMWHDLWPGRAIEAVPITHVTNGVHLATWLGGPMRALLDRHLPPGWLEQAAHAKLWEAVAEIPVAELWQARREQRAHLVEHVREVSVGQRLGRGDPLARARAAAECFDPDVLTIGFARRLATYKRLSLLIADGNVELLRRERPIQFLMAGKAHPRDEEGKRMLQALFSLKDVPGVPERVVFLDDYDLRSAALLVQGCDVWVNLPRPPLEACGTSGMKSAANGGLHLSVLDGWWAEAYTGINGWALPGDVDPDHAAQDARDGAELRRLLDDEVIPVFYERDVDGLPRAWLARVRASLRSLAGPFSAGRMLDEYVAHAYGTD